MLYAFNACTEDHRAMCADVPPFCAMYSSLLKEIEMLPDVSKTELKPRLTELYGIHQDYLSHLLPTKHQGDY